MKQPQKLSRIVVAVGALALALSVGSLGMADVGGTGAAPVDILGAQIKGDYVEARTCDVWTGPCFSNSEINLKGDHGVMAWSVREGKFNGVSLNGLLVAASIDAQGTLGTLIEGRVRAVLYVDKRATRQQSDALVAMVKKLAPRYTKNVIKVEKRQISFKRQGQRVELVVGGSRPEKKAEAQIKTRALMEHCDVVCGNEEKAYPSLARTTKAICAMSLIHAYRGADLGANWSEPGARSAMVGGFEL